MFKSSEKSSKWPWGIMIPDLPWASVKTQSCSPDSCHNQAIFRAISVNFGESQKLNSFLSVALCQWEELLWDKKSANKKITKGQRQRYIFMLNHGSLRNLCDKNSKIWARLQVWAMPCFHLCGAKSRVCVNHLCGLHTQKNVFLMESKQ